MATGGQWKGKYLMAAIVVDTDIVSYQFKGDSRASLYRPHLAGKQWCLSFMTQAELAGP